MACCSKAGAARSAKLKKSATMKATKKANAAVKSGTKPKKADPKKTAARKAAARKATPCKMCGKAK
jgi:hypothetical protein